MEYLTPFLAVLPSVAAMFSSKITEFVKSALAKVSVKIPKPLKPVLAVLLGAVAAAACPGGAENVVTDGVLGGIVGLAGAFGYGTAKAHDAA